MRELVDQSTRWEIAREALKRSGITIGREDRIPLDEGVRVTELSSTEDLSIEGMEVMIILIATRRSFLLEITTIVSTQEEAREVMRIANEAAAKLMSCNYELTMETRIEPVAEQAEETVESPTQIA